MLMQVLVVAVRCDQVIDQYRSAPALQPGRDCEVPQTKGSDRLKLDKAVSACSFPDLHYVHFLSKRDPKPLPLLRIC
jgi:hypothetical protein